MKTKELTPRKRLENYILSCISTEGYGVSAQTTEEKLKFIVDTFKSEYGYNINKYGKYRAFSEWLQGLPSSMNIAFYYSEIIELGKQMGFLKPEASEKSEDSFTDQWFNRLTIQFTAMCGRYSIDF